MCILTPLSGRDDPDLLVPGYSVGSPIPETAFRPGIRQDLERELLAGDGKAFSLVVVAPEAEGQDVTVGQLTFKRTSSMSSFRARVYMFAQGQEGG